MRRTYLFDDAQRRELSRLSRTDPRPYVRVRALALCHVASGEGVGEAASAVRAHRSSVGGWVARYLAEGASGLAVRPGAGRPSGVDAEQVRDYALQSPRAFGLPLTRWTLAALAEAVPRLRGMTPSGVGRALGRIGLSYKRGQPRLHSPDPEYAAKKAPSTGP